PTPADRGPDAVIESIASLVTDLTDVEKGKRSTLIGVGVGAPGPLDIETGTIIRAVFPGGSITGCPKVRCMEIIEQLETRPRGVYTGAMGYINRDGGADLNILIRTIAVTGRDVSIATGSGIVADSDPYRELEETRAKARGVLLAIDGTADG
ncbi:MAG: chorismate-binding protein, partial [Gammaproteobacteria bacterium]